MTPRQAAKIQEIRDESICIVAKFERTHGDIAVMTVESFARLDHDPERPACMPSELVLRIEDVTVDGWVRPSEVDLAYYPQRLLRVVPRRGLWQRLVRWATRAH